MKPGTHHASPRETARTALEILNRSGNVSGFFAYDREWLEQRLTIWNSRTWRIGLIGITSSGKSTLLNALLGQPLLPMRVRPSSNGLVICCAGDTLKCVVHFEDGREQVRKGRVRIASALAALTDENSNPGNEKQVKEIELYSPEFKLERRVALIDTPGLDAADLARHEAVTMQLLLPSVDAVVFLTTTKANADRQILAYLDSIGQHGKPVVLVQNMRDAVEPKLGIGGVEVRSQLQVLEEHLVRQRKLLARSEYEVVRNAPVFQVSAHRATQGHYEDSGVPNLVSALNGLMQQLEPQLVAGRFRQLRDHLERMVTSARQPPASADEALLAQMDALRRQTRHNERIYRTLRRDLVQIADDACAHSKHLLRTARELTGLDMPSAKRLVDEIATWRGRSPEAMRCVLAGYQKQSDVLAGELNLQSQDLQVPQPKRQADTHLAAYVGRKQTRTKRALPGFFNAIFRTLGIGGTTVDVHSWEEVDVTRLERDLKTSIAAELDWINGMSTKIEESVAPINRRLKLEVSRRRRDASTKQELRQRHAAEVNSAIDQIGALCAELPLAPQPADISQRVTASARAPAAGTTLSAATLGRAPHDVGADLLRQRDAVLEQCTAIDRRAGRRSLIWGNDKSSVESFVGRFWFDAVIGSPESFECIEPAGSMEAVAVAVETAYSASVDLAKAIRSFVAKPATLFLLVDAEAPGSSASQLERSQIWSVAPNASALVLVMQRARALENSGSLAEGVLALKSLAERMPLAVTKVMANDDRWYIGALVAALFHEGHLLKTMRDEKAWTHRFAEPGQLPPATVAQTLRCWRELSESS